MSAHLTLGQILKRIRASRGWTLRDMSEGSGIPFSTLSKVENDRLTLTYDKLLQISQRLKIPISDFFAETTSTTDPSVMARRSIGTIEDSVRVTTPNYDYYYLCTELRRKRMVPILTRIRAKSLSEFGELVRHSGEEYIHVLEGSIEVHTEYYDPVTLKTGEAIYIDSNMGHAYIAAAECDEALVLGVCSSADEGLMSSLMSMHGPDDHKASNDEPDQPGRSQVRRPAA